MYAQVIFGLPIEGPFDYMLPDAWRRIAKPGMRVEVSFGHKCHIGYIVGIARHTEAKNIKPVIDMIDKAPVLDKTMLRITKEVSDYYACSWGEAVEASVPLSLRQGRKIEQSITGINQPKTQGISQGVGDKKESEVFLLQSVKGDSRWEIYLSQINEFVAKDKGIIILTPDRYSAEFIRGKIQSELGLEVGLLHSHQSAREELNQWIQIKNGSIKIVVGTRMAIFAPLVNLGLIIIEQEQSWVYKQESSPHYNAVGVARIRSRLQRARLIFSSLTPSLETWYATKRGKIKYILKENHIAKPNVNIIDLHRVGFVPQRRKIKLSIALEDAINKALRENARVLLFLNRRGFAIFASCQQCGKVLLCPRCNANLILHFKENTLNCHSCNYKAACPRICPNCKSGYMRYAGLGTERLESELSRLYPQVNIARFDKENKNLPADGQIIIATESIFSKPAVNLDLIGVLAPDYALNLPDFRAAEKVFALLLELSRLTDKAMFIQTSFPDHYCFQAISQNRVELFYETELKFRRQSHLPPFTNIIVVSLRGRNEQKGSFIAEELYNLLNHTNLDKNTQIIAHYPQTPHKRRDYFYEQILIKTKSVTRAVRFLKKTLTSFRRSGIIITVDVDPV